MKNGILFVAAFFLFTFAAMSQKLQTQSAGNCFTIDVPLYMTKTYDLNDAATIQYQNTNKEAYMIVIEDDKEQLNYLGMKFIDSKDFLEDFVKEYNIEAKDRKVSEITQFTNNGNGHSQAEMSWQSDEDDTRFAMLITVVETKKHFYKIMCWSIQPNYKNLKADYLEVSKSLKD